MGSKPSDWDPHMKDKYLIVGGRPVTMYTGTTTFTNLYVVGTANSESEAKKIYKDSYDKCGGLLIIIDTETLKPVEGW